MSALLRIVKPAAFCDILTNLIYTRKNRIVQKMSLWLMLSVGNYNARVGFWEPMLELSSFRLAVELLKRDVSEGRFKKCAVHLAIENTLNLNLSDAGLEMIGMLLRESKRVDEVEVEDGESGVIVDATAGVALEFAKKGRGVEKEETKPFLLRNKAGVKLAFVAQTARKAMEAMEADDAAEKNTYGLECFDKSAIIEVGVGEEAKFEFSDAIVTEIASDGDVRVRMYDGKLPTITVALDPKLGLGLLSDLPVSRVGTIVKEIGGISVAWTVSIEENRRVLTIGSSTKIVAELQGDVVLEVGVLEGGQRKIAGDVKRGLPLVLPLCPPNEDGTTFTDVRVRVKGGESWSNASIVSNKIVTGRDEKVVCTKEGDTAMFIYCMGDKRDGLFSTVFLYSSFSLENLIPRYLDFELADGLPAVDRESVHMLANTGLKVGDSVDCLSCDVNSCMPTLRFKMDGLAWSNWIDLPSAHRIGRKRGEKSGGKMNMEEASDRGDVRATEVIYSQARDFGGVPFTFAIRVGRKSVAGVFVDALNVVLFCDCWLENRSGIDLVVGAPAEQIFSAGDKMVTNQSVRAAEAAAVLSDLVSLFDVGDTARRLEEEEEGNFWILPMQNASEVWDEVFECVEVDSQEVVRRTWFAGENPRFARNDRRKIVPPEGWKWSGGWMLCKAGGVNADGWESCESLSGGLINGFKGTREFDQTHKIRRRRFVRRRVRVGDVPGSHRGFTLQLHQAIKDKGSGKRVGVVDSISTNKGDDSLVVVFKLKDSIWSSPVCLSPTRTKSDFFYVHEGRYLDLPGKPGGALRVHDMCYWSKRHDRGGMCTIVDYRFVIHNSSEMFDMCLKQYGTNEAVRIGKGETIKWSWADWRLEKKICVRIDGDAAWDWSGAFRIDAIGISTVRVWGGEFITKEGSEDERLVRSIRAHSEVRKGTGGLGAYLDLREETFENAMITIDNDSPWPIFVKQEISDADGTEGKGPGEIFYRGIGIFGWEKPELGVTGENLILRLGLGPLDDEGVDMRFIPLRVRNDSNHKCLYFCSFI